MCVCVVSYMYLLWISCEREKQHILDQANLSHVHLIVDCTITFGFDAIISLERFKMNRMK